MFGSGESRRRHAGVGIIRLFMSLIIFSILGVGLYMAYRDFSGYDPLKLDVRSLSKTIFNSDAAADFITKLLSFSPTQGLGGKISETLPSNDETPKSTAALKFKFAVIADSHRDYTGLQKALEMAKNQGAQFVVGIGDFSDIGTIDELVNTKKQFDTAKLPYYVTAGDHDLWDARDKKKSPESNFRQVFGTPYQAFSYSEARFLIFYDSDNYLGLDSVQLKWIEDELTRIKAEGPQNLFVFASTPLYHPSSDHVVGKLTPKIKDQADHLISLFQKAGVDEVFFSDTHFFSRYTEPTTNLKMTTVGAVTSDRNPQTPRFAMVDVLVDGSYNVEEIEVK